MNTDEFYFDLPKELIAQTPLIDRSSSRLLVLDKKSGDLKHENFKNIVSHLNKGDCLVVNNTKVLPARLIGEKFKTGGRVEILLLNRKDGDKWESIVFPGKKCKVGAKISFGKDKLLAEVIEVLENGNRIVEFSYEGIFNEILEQLGEMPLPPYITEKLEDKDRYQTVYAKEEGSAAAPTAGLHFTDEIFKELKEKGVEIAYVTLHVGLGTFRPVKVSNVLEHDMHSEYYVVLQEQADIINKCKENGGKIVSVGTTSCRTLESSNENGRVVANSGYTNIFIYPSYKFKIIDSLITNFHLPESTLIMLVSALSSKEIILNAYNEAVKERYRFFSFGDAMFIK